MSGTNAVAWAVGASATNSSLPAWPAYAFGVMALIGLYVLGAALARFWPFNRLALSPAELLDDRIRAGRELRARIAYEKLDGWQEAREASEWTLRTANLLHEHFPAIADEFLFVEPAPRGPSNQAPPAVPALAAKLDVLAAARKGLTG